MLQSLRLQDASSSVLPVFFHALATPVFAHQVIGDHTTTDFASMDKLCGALVQYPDTRGRYFKFEGIADALHKSLGVQMGLGVGMELWPVRENK